MTTVVEAYVSCADDPEVTEETVRARNDLPLWCGDDDEGDSVAATAKEFSDCVAQYESTVVQCNTDGTPRVDKSLCDDVVAHHNPG